MRIRDYSPQYQKRKQWSSEELQFLFASCNNFDCFSLASRLGRSQDSVRGKLRNLGLKAKDTQRLQTEVNHDFFKTWSKPMSYILGYWFADGYMGQPPMWTFSVSSKDIQILQSILKIMGSMHKITDGGKKIYHFIVGSKTIWNDLWNLGGRPAKSLIAEPPNVPANFVPHFIRGIFDGDGCVCFSRGSIRLNFCGTRAMMEYVCSKLPCKMTVYQIKRCANHWRLDNQGQNAISNLQWMYDNASIWLDRKRTRFQSLLSSMQPLV